MDALKSLVQPLVGGTGGSSMIDGMKLVVLGGTVETARRVSSSAWSHFVNSFFLTAHFSEADYPYDWLMLWLSRRPEWQRSREFETTTRTSSYGMPGSEDYSFGDEDLDGASTTDDELAPGKMKTRVIFQPTFDTTHTIYYRGHLLRVKRGRKNDGSMTEMLVVARNNSILKQLVLQAKKEYEAEAIHRIQIYFADSYGSWRWSGSRHKRPMSSIVLNKGVKEMLLADTRDFLKSEKWYADRGIPFRRGYLLHGVPGSGKSSLIHAIAGELMLDIYVVSLSSSWMNDSTLQTLMGRVPARCILLLEDLDAAFTRSVTRDKNSNGLPEGQASEETTRTTTTTTGSSGRHGRRHRNTEQLSEVNTLSLSGLLNALDGIAAAEGRLLFATTNHLERLDPALSRPGRMDVWIEFKNASKWQAEALFRNFFPSVEDINKADNDIILDAGELEGIEIPTSPPASVTSSASSAGAASVPTSPVGSTGVSSLWSMSPISSTISLSSSPSSSAPGPASTAPSSIAAACSRPVSDEFGSQNQAYIAPPVEEHIANASHSARPLDSATLNRFAKIFADAIPDEEFSVAALQGYLLKNKSQPEAAASEAAKWVESEREMKERLKREREEKELKEKLESEKLKQEVLDKEREKKELEQKEAELIKMKQQLEEATTAAKANPSTADTAALKEKKKNIANAAAAIEKQKADQAAKEEVSKKVDDESSEGDDDDAENKPVIRAAPESVEESKDSSPAESESESKDETEQDDSEGWGTLI